MNPRARSVYFSMFITALSLGLPPMPRRRNVGIVTGYPRPSLMLVNTPVIVRRNQYAWCASPDVGADGSKRKGLSGILVDFARHRLASAGRTH